MKTEKNILLRFKEIFRSTALTKSEFSKNLNIEHRSLNKYLDGDYDIQKISIRLIRLGYSINWLYTGEGKKYFGDKLDKQQIESLQKYNIQTQKERIRNWINENYENVIEYEINRYFKRNEIQNIFKNNDPIPYLILIRIESSGCNLHWSMTGDGICYADNYCGNKLKEKNEK